MDDDKAIYEAMRIIASIYLFGAAITSRAFGSNTTPQLACELADKLVTEIEQRGWKIRPPEDQ